MAAATPRNPDLDQLREIVVSFASKNGESEPTRVWMVVATSTAAWAVLSGHRDNQPPIPVYVVVANGDFVGYMTKRPPGAPPPKGTALFMLLERNARFSCVGWGLSRSTPDLRKLGPVTAL